MGVLEFLLWLSLGAMAIGSIVAMVYFVCGAGKAKKSRPEGSRWGPSHRPRNSRWGPPPRSYGLRPPRPRPEPPPLPEPGPVWETKTTSLFFGDGTGGKNSIELDGSHVKFSKDGEVVYEGPLDDAPDDVIRAVRSFRQGIGKFDFDAFDGISESLNDGMDQFRKDMDKFRDDMDKFHDDMDDFGKETDKP